MVYTTERSAADQFSIHSTPRGRAPHETMAIISKQDSNGNEEMTVVGFLPTLIREACYQAVDSIFIDAGLNCGGLTTSPIDAAEQTVVVLAREKDSRQLYNDARRFSIFVMGGLPRNLKTFLKFSAQAGGNTEIFYANSRGGGVMFELDNSGAGSAYINCLDGISENNREIKFDPNSFLASGIIVKRDLMFGELLSSARAYSEASHNFLRSALPAFS